MSSSYFYKDHPQTCEPDDFWGQVKRTVGGRPVSPEQIEMIVAAVTDGLALRNDDQLLDICCGNGALTTRFFTLCCGGLGVDISEYLIDVAQRNFVRHPGEVFVVQNVLDFVRCEPDPGRFSKALCYGSFQYLPTLAAEELLSILRNRFDQLERVFIGNIPDKARLYDYYRLEDYMPGIEDSADTPIGIWRTSDTFVELAARTGWLCEIRRMPEFYYAARYRYDVVLRPTK